MAAVTVSDFYAVRAAARDRGGDDAARPPIDGRLGVVRSASRWPRSGWIGRCSMPLAVLSLAKGPVLGAFLVGVRRAGSNTRDAHRDNSRYGRAGDPVVDSRGRVDVYAFIGAAVTAGLL
jgi:hypothetical protein